MIKRELSILGVRVDNLDKKQIFEKTESFLSDDKFHQIATINPEFILEAQKNKEFRDILNSCDLNVADGIGIRFAFWRYGEKLKARVAGIDLMNEILKIANDRRLEVFLVANKDGLSTWEETAKAIKKIFPNLRISGANLDKKISNFPALPAGRQFPISNKIQNSENYKVIFCNFGHPHQEFFLNRQKDAIMGIAMGVGGSFDFLTGKLRRASRIMRLFGLEWLFRLIQQPHRFRRIFNAVIIFPIKVLINKK